MRTLIPSRMMHSGIIVQQQMYRTNDNNKKKIKKQTHINIYCSAHDGFPQIHFGCCTSSVWQTLVVKITLID